MRLLTAVDGFDMRFLHAGYRLSYGVMSNDLICKPQFGTTLDACVRMYIIYF